jgi:hypothetical protein
MGLPIKDLGGTEIPGAPGKYLLANVPVLHHAFVNYIAEAAPTAGLCWIKGIGKPIETNRFGMSLRTQYEEMRDKLATAYGTKFKETDALLAGSIWKLKFPRFYYATRSITVAIRGFRVALPPAWQSIPKPRPPRSLASERRRSPKAYSVRLFVA